MRNFFIKSFVCLVALSAYVGAKSGCEGDEEATDCKPIIERIKPH